MDNDQTDNIVIRHVTHNDINSILALDKKVGVGKSSITYRDMVSLDFGGPLDFSFVAEIENRVVGFIIARLAYVLSLIHI